MLCFVVVMQSFIMNSHEVFIHIHQGCFAGTGAIVRLPQCQWSKPDGYGKISQCITTTKQSKAKTVCIFLGIYCISMNLFNWASGYRYALGQSTYIYWSSWLGPMGLALPMDGITGAHGPNYIHVHSHWGLCRWIKAWWYTHHRDCHWIGLDLIAFV